MSNDIAVSAPAPTLLAGTNGVVKTAPAPSLSATLTWPGDDISLAFAHAAPAPRLSSTLLAGDALTLVLQAPLPALVAVLETPSILTFSRSARAPRLSASLLIGQVATAALEAPAPTLIAAGYPASIIAVALTAPAPRLSAALAAAITAAFRSWVLNTRKLALTEYSGFSFNSYATFNGQVLAAGSSGIVVLGTQGTDAGTAIDMTLTTGREGFASSFHKRVPRIYASGEFAGDALFTATTVEGGARVYSLPFNGVTGVQQRRVPVGKGPKSRFWQFSVANVAGADLSLNDLNVFPVILRRRVQ